MVVVKVSTIACNWVSAEAMDCKEAAECKGLAAAGGENNTLNSLAFLAVAG